MRILIAFDGSQPAQDSIQALRTAGLPEYGVEAHVLSAEEDHSPAMEPAVNIDPNLPIVTYAFETAHEAELLRAETAEGIAEDGALMVRQLFPDWNVTPVGRLEGAATAIFELADEWKPDLIVLGSHGYSALQRLVLGSVSLRVLREAETSVRITRKAPITDPAYPPVLLLAYDASPGANKVVRKLMHRTWPRHTQLHIVSVIDVSILSTRNYLWLVGSDLREFQATKESRIEQAVHDLERSLRGTFDVTSAICVGAPVQEILKEARRVQADSIYMGSRGLSRLERLLLGSVVQGVASHAETTVEIVR